MSTYSHAFLPHTRSARLISILAFVAALVCAVAVSFAGSAHSIAPAGFTGYQVITGSPVAISDGATVSAVIDCPSGKSALSGGISSHNSMMFLDVLAPVSASEWSMTVTQAGTLGYTEHFTPYIICLDSVSVPGLHYNTTANTAAANAQTIKDAFCDLNTEYVVGGGFNAGLSGPHGSISYPVDDNRTWQVGIDNTTGSPTAFTVYAVCVPQADVSSYSQLSGDFTSFAAYMDQAVPGGPSTARTNNGASASGYCPSGTLASGGGVFDHDQDNDGFIVSSYPSTDFRYWLQTSTDLNPPSYGEWAAATVICVTASITIDTTTTVSLSPPSPGLNQSTLITATVTPQSGSGTPTGTVTFYDNGTPIGSATLSGGSASITTTFGGGSHSITASYGGDSTYNPSTSAPPVTFTIACATTITGTHGSITATTPGLTCVSNAVINGAIVIVNGSLDVENSTVRGAVSVSNGTGVRICGSTTNSVTVSNASGFARVGDAANGCAPNTIAGSVTASSNHGGGAIIGNTLTGSVVATSNVPAFAVSGNHH